MHVLAPPVTVSPAASSIAYTRGNPAVTLLGTATFSDSAATKFAGSTLIVSSSNAADQLTAQSTGGITLNPTTLAYNGAAIGTVRGNTIHFTASATQAAAQAVIRSYAFASAGPVGAHTVTFQFTGSQGNTGRAAVTVNVG